MISRKILVKAKVEGGISALSMLTIWKDQWNPEIGQDITYYLPY